MRIIPAIDIIEGKCVRLTQGDFKQMKVYHDDPLELAKMFEAEGMQYLHLVDLDGARGKGLANTHVLKRIAGNTNLQVDFGGGIKTGEAIRSAFEYGAQQVTVGSIAVANEALFTEWLTRYDADRIILGADVLHGHIAVQGWAEQTDLQLMPFLERYQQEGVQYVVCTDISKDGLLQGCSMELYHDIRQQFPQLKLIASGGISSLSDLDQLQKLGVDGVIVGKAIYENRISFKDLRAYAD